MKRFSELRDSPVHKAGIDISYMSIFQKGGELIASIPLKTATFILDFEEIKQVQEKMTQYFESVVKPNPMIDKSFVQKHNVSPEKIKELQREMNKEYAKGPQKLDWAHSFLTFTGKALEFHVLCI